MQDTPARGTADHDDGGQVRPRRVQQRRLRDPRIPGHQPLDRRANGCSSRSASTLRDDTPDYKLDPRRNSLETPDGKTIPLPTAIEQREGNIQAIQQRARVQRDSINYFPPEASRACAILFFPELGARSLPYDESTSSTTAPVSAACIFVSRAGSHMASIGST